MIGEQWGGRSLMIATRSCFEWDLATYLLDILRGEGINTSVFEYRGFDSPATAGQALVTAVEAHRPDWLLGLKLEAVAPSALAHVRASGVPVALWNVDCFTPDLPDWILPLLAEVDLVFTTAEGMLPAYRQVCRVPVHWVVEGAHLPAFPIADTVAERYRSEVAFLGNVFQPPVPNSRLALRRLRLLTAIGERFDLRVWGPQSPDCDRHPQPMPFRMVRWPAYNEECVKVCRAADVVLGINTTNRVLRYFSNRTFVTLACGGFHLTEYVPGLETMFENERHLVWYYSDEECLERIEEFLRRPEDRARIAEAGRQHVLQHYNLNAQVAKLLHYMEAAHGWS